MSDNFKWHKMKDKDIPAVEKLLRENEDNYVNACGRYLSRKESNDPVWLLKKQNGRISSLVVSSRSALMPVLCGVNKIPQPDFLGGFLNIKKIHSVQGLKDEVILLEEALEKTGRKPADKYDYDLMELNSLRVMLNKNQKARSKEAEKLVIRAPVMSDLNDLSVLQAGYEKEEVIPKGSVFNPAASRVNAEAIIAGGMVLAAELDGRIIGKINTNAVSFTRYQVGGVYVHPDFRGKGIASRMTYEFTASLLSGKRGVTLFVKKTNAAARRLYLNLGFTVKSDYRITYY